MTEDQNNKKIIKDVKSTSDEAARLLAGLEESCIEQPSVQKSHQETQKPRNPYQATNRNIDPTFTSAILVPIIASGILVFFFALAIGTQKTSVNEESSSSANETNRESIEKQKKTMTPYQRRFYEQTLAKAKDAVLKREHEAAISDLRTLMSGNYKELTDIDNGLVNDKIIQAKKAIAYLEQPGDAKYWEGANYGFQWFDTHTNNQFRVFFAHSRKCSNPLVTFGYRPSSENKSGQPTKTISIKPKSYKSTILVPYYGEYALWVEDFKCY